MITRIIIILIATCFTWFNIIRWVPAILTSPIILLTLGTGILLIIIGAVRAISNNS